MRVRVEVSNRHVHLTKEVVSTLFGHDFNLSVRNELSQHGEFASNSTVSIKTDKATIEHVRVVGPVRNYTQVEISKSDAKYLGLKPPKRDSGNLKSAPGITLIGPKGEVFVDECVIIANRHLHLNPKEAKKYKFKNNEIVQAIIDNKEMNDIHVKISESYTPAIHIDKDDAEKFGIIKSSFAHVVKRNFCLNFIVLFIEIFILLIVLDFFCHNFFNTTPMIPRKITEGEHKIYQGFGYKIFDCKTSNGRKIHIKSLETDFKCSNNNFEIIDRTGDVCAEMLLLIYEDDDYKYYLPCLKSIFIKFENESELEVEKAIQIKAVSIEDLEVKGLTLVKEIK